MSYGRNENDEKALSWFKLIVSLTSLWIPQAYPPQLLHFKAFISGKSHEAFRPENVLLINRSYHEGSSLTLFIFFSTIYCLLCMQYFSLLLVQNSGLSASKILCPPGSQPFSAIHSYLLSALLWSGSIQVRFLPCTCTPHCSFLPWCCLSFSAGTALLWDQEGTEHGNCSRKIGNCFTSWISSLMSHTS